MLLSSNIRQWFGTSFSLAAWQPLPLSEACRAKTLARPVALVGGTSRLFDHTCHNGNPSSSSWRGEAFQADMKERQKRPPSRAKRRFSPHLRSIYVVYVHVCLHGRNLSSSGWEKGAAAQVFSPLFFALSLCIFTSRQTAAW